MSKSSCITCVGEILWDALPAGLFLGGAPLNVCLNLNQLGATAQMVSRVGKDRLGKEACDRIEKGGLSTAYIQQDDKYETGFVKVEVNSEGDPEYQILHPAAWDYINIRERNISKLLKNSWAVVFGTLAHRQNPSLGELLALKCKKVLDMNLRAPHFEKGRVMELVEQSDILKMNEDEMRLLQKWYSLPGNIEEAAWELSSRYNCQTICITRGREGSVLLHRNNWLEHRGYAVNVKDAVGAGDAFLAALLYGLKTEREQQQLLPLANAAGAFVASQSGANPEFSIGFLESVMSGELSLE